MATISNLRAAGRSFLKKAGITSYNIDTDVLLMHVFEVDKNTLLTDLRRPANPDLDDKFMRLINARCNHVPVQYLTGKCEFMSLEFMVNQSTLIPRPDTEILVETILAAETPENVCGLEIGVGCGCISISLEYYADNIVMRGVDINPEAVLVATQNYMRIPRPQKAPIHSKNIEFASKIFRNSIFIVSDLFQNVPRGTLFDFIVSNPPYIETDEIERLDSCVKDYEPRAALDGGPDGLKYYRLIAEQAGRYLTQGGRIYFEIGYNQARAVEGILAAAGYLDIKILDDYAGKNRVVCGRRA